MIPKRVIIHCSDTPNFKRVDISEIRKWHTDPKPKGRGWSDVGYHLVIQPDGEKQIGRKFNQIGAHTRGQNHDSLGICLIGKNEWTDLAFDSLREFMISMRQHYDINPWDMYCHSFFNEKKTCPNIEIQRLVAFCMTWGYDALGEQVVKYNWDGFYQ